MHLIVDGTNELVLHDVRYVPSIKKSLLSVGQMDMLEYSALFEKGSWKLIKGSKLIVKGTNKGTLYCWHSKSLIGKFVASAEIHSHIELLRKRLGHMSQKGLDTLCNLDMFNAKSSKHGFCN